MFTKLRRTSKVSKPQHDRPDDKTVLATATGAPTKTTFFSLPAELRNTVYELVAETTTLQITHQRPGLFSKKKAVSTPGLLVTSQQSRSEFLPILLSSAAIGVQVTDFDFSNLMRVTGSLYSTELRALRLNPGLMVNLVFTLRPKLGVMESNLRRWATHRSAALDRLPWQYKLGVDSSSAVGLVVYARCMANLQMVYLGVEEALQWEIQNIMNSVERENHRAYYGCKEGSDCCKSKGGTHERSRMASWTG